MVAINTDVVDSIEMRDRAKIPLTVNVRAKISDTGTPSRLSGLLRVDLTPSTSTFSNDCRSGVKKISFFTDFWLINKTGLRLLYRQQAGLGASEPAPGQVAAASDDSLWDLKGTYHHRRSSCSPYASRARSLDTHTPARRAKGLVLQGPARRG